MEASKLKIEEEEEKLEAKKKQSIQALQQKMDEELRKTEMEMKQVCVLFSYVFNYFIEK